MNDLIVVPTCFPEVFILHPKTYCDHRGFFRETYNATKLVQHGFRAPTFVQDNHSRSTQDVLRGLHYQIRFPQVKLVSVIRGTIYDVVVDIRPDSPNFGMYAGFTLSEVNQLSLYVPGGFAHGFLVQSEWADISYKCSDYYHPGDDGGILWSDPDLKIPWGIGNPILSPKDAVYPCLKDISNDKLPKIHHAIGIF